MFYQIINDVIINEWPAVPTSIIVDGNNIYFPKNISLAFLEEKYNVFRITPIEIERDIYHNYIPYVEIISGRPYENYTITDKSIADATLIKKTEIDMRWRDGLRNGKFTSTAVSGFIVDCRRGDDVNNDPQNIDGKIARIESNADTNPTMWVGYEEVRLLTLDQLKAIKLEMIDYADSIYNRKFIANYMLANATTVEDIQKVTF